MSLTWDYYVMGHDASDDSLPVSHLWDAARTTDNHETLYILGSGFDPRGLVGLSRFLDTVGRERLRVAAIPLPPGKLQHGELTGRLAENNAARLGQLTSDISALTVDYPEGVDAQRAGALIARELLAPELLDAIGHVVIDVASLPSHIYFPVVAAFLRLHDQGGFTGEVQVVACDNPKTDSMIMTEGIDAAGPIAGFGAQMRYEAGAARTTVWAPVLGEGATAALEREYELLAPNAIHPVLPFPARDPRRADRLVLEYRDLLFDHFEVDPRDFVHAHESNPFDLYRTLCYLADDTRRALEPLGDTLVAVSTHASKLLNIGALLAAHERELVVVAASPEDYWVDDGIDVEALRAEDQLACMWLKGEPTES